MITPQKFNEMIQTFKQMNYIDQHHKVIKILQRFAKIGGKYAKLLYIIQHDTQQKIPSNILIDIYQAIMTLGHKNQQIRKQQAINKLENTIIKIKTIQKQEYLEKIQENPDALLDQII